MTSDLDPARGVCNGAATSMVLWCALALLLGGCGWASPTTQTAALATTQGNPIVRAVAQGNATLTVISCPMTLGGSEVLANYLQTLAAAGPVVVAGDRATARMTLNLCSSPFDEAMIRALVPLQRRR